MRKLKLRFLTLLLIIQPSSWIFILTDDVSAQIKKPANKPVKSSPAASIGEFTAQARYALVVGNGAYPEIPLRNSINDAAEIAKSLRSVDFNVTEKKNLTLAEMRGAIEEFSRKLPPDAVGMFFFAGHGIQVSGKNFLLPIDYKDVKNERELVATNLDLDSIVTAISKRSGLTIIVLDACRNNDDTDNELALSFKTEKGFAAPPQTTGGIYIAYSTKPGAKAYDGRDGEKNSPYTKALAQNLRLSPGRLEDIFIKTRIEVRNETAGYEEGEQVPWENGSLSRLFYFTPDKLRPAATLTPQNSAVVAKPVLTKPKLPFGVTSLLKISFAAPRLDESGSRLGLDNRTADYFVEKSLAADLPMVEIPSGTFQMGSSFEEVEQAYADALKSNDEADREVITAEMPKHQVNVRGFFMSRTEITQAQWRAVMGSLPEMPPDSRGDQKPVVNVSWNEARAFCDKLSVVSKRNYRLPSEAEWEYAARAGTQTAFAYGENINSNYVNFFAYVPFAAGAKGDYREKTVVAGSLNAPNLFGLDDVHGNVAEWCADYWHPDYNGAPTDGSAWNKPAQMREDDAEDPAYYRVVRGGAFDSIGVKSRSAARRALPITEETRYSNLGFRVVVAD